MLCRAAKALRCGAPEAVAQQSESAGTSLVPECSLAVGEAFETLGDRCLIAELAELYERIRETLGGALVVTPSPLDLAQRLDGRSVIELVTSVECGSRRVEQ